MKCNNCGREVQDNMTVCSCGAQVYAQPTDKNDSKKKKIIGIVIGAVCAIAIAVVVFVFLSSPDYVETVKTGELKAYPGETIGEAFEDFFSNGEWEEFESSKGMVVQFTGGCTYYDEEVECVVQFLFTDKDEGEFEVYTVEIDGEPISELEIVGMLDAVYEE